MSGTVRRLFTSESVTEGHPDKIADQISDAILDSLLKDDPKSRVAVETMITTGQVHIAGEVTTSAYADIPRLVRETILGIGYDSSKKGFDGASCGVSVSIGSPASDIDLDTLLTPDIRERVVVPEVGALDLDTSDYRVLINPTGRFEIGGPMGDAGLTGRKIIVDTYGGMARHGGGAFSGKDPSKVDRSAAYAARYVAKNCVAAGLADRLEGLGAYAIGVAHPISVMVDTFGTERI